MAVLGVILARAGSKGLPDKCVLPLAGRPVIVYTFQHARQSRRLTDTLLTTDSARAAALARAEGITVVERPPELATDTARVDDVVRHAVSAWESARSAIADIVVVLYGNVPVRADGVIDRCIDLLLSSGCDSVRSVAPVTKQHPDWIHRLEGDRLIQFRPNSIHRRQDLEPLYYHDGAVVVVTRRALFAAAGQPDPHAFFGADRRAIVGREEDTVDIDTPADFYRAEAAIRLRAEAIAKRPAGGSAAPSFTAVLNCGSGHEQR